MNYLFIGAHPDDVEYSCGGTILRLVAEGHNVSIAVITGGGNSLSGTEQERRSEQLSACKYSKVNKLFTLDYVDGKSTSIRFR